MPVGTTPCDFQYGIYIYLSPANIGLRNPTYGELVNDDSEVNSIYLQRKTNKMRRLSVYLFL